MLINPTNFTWKEEFYSIFVHANEVSRGSNQDKIREKIGVQ